MTKRLVVVAFVFALATSLVACTTTNDYGSGGSNCVLIPTSPSCGSTVPPVVYDGFNPPVWHRFVRADGTDDPYLEVALLEEPIPARGAIFKVPGCLNPCISLRIAVRMEAIPGQQLASASIGLRTSIDGVNPSDGSLGGFRVQNGQTVEYNTRSGAVTWFVANSYKWVLLQTTYGVVTNPTPGSGTTQFSSTGRLFMDYGPRQ